MMKLPVRIAFVCTGNACRSQMAEAIMRKVGGDRFDVSSGGSNPAGYIHPVAIKTMASMGFSLAGHHSKSWSRLAQNPQDALITLCDHAAAQSCPNWVGHPVTVHWSLPDPSFHPGTPEERLQAARDVAETLRKRAEHLAALPVETLAPDEFRKELEFLADLW